MQHATISNALIQRLKIIDTYKAHPEIADEVIDGPIVVLGLPRTGTTALGQLISADSQFRCLRTWESQAPTPPPDTATQHNDPRIDQAAEGIAMIEQMFPDFRATTNAEPEAATECQDLMGMSFRTFHFDGVVRVPGYVEWLMRCDMRETYTFHRDVLKLLQWRCKPSLWNLRTPVHMRGENMTTVGEFIVGEGDRVPFVLSYGASHLPIPAAFAPDAALKDTQEFWDERYSSVEMGPSPDWVKLAEAFGATGMRCEDEADLEEMMGMSPQNQIDSLHGGGEPFVLAQAQVR